ncbi:MAG: sigma-70 family RNA polymerase sigma factor [Gaiellaceae bacterium]
MTTRPKRPTTTATRTKTKAATTDHAHRPTGRLSTEAAGARLSELFEEHGRMVYGVCRVLLRDPQEAEDASQQTFLSAQKSMLAGHEVRDPGAWLGTIARNECRERIRARMSAPLTLVDQDAVSLGVEDVAGRRAEIEALCAALAELPQHQREAIVLREFYGLSYGEVRAALGVTDAAVESLLFRARKRLQKELRPARVASGALALPLGLRDSIASAIPGFASSPESAGMLAKLASLPIAAKLAAAAMTVTVAGTVGATTLDSHDHGVGPAPAQAARMKEPSAAASRHSVALIRARAGEAAQESAAQGSRADERGEDEEGESEQAEEQTEDSGSAEAGESGESDVEESDDGDGADSSGEDD